jgi:LysM repeat protein
MRHKTSRWAFFAVMLLIVVLLLAACQRDRPAAEDEGWVDSPIEEPATTPVAETATTPAPDVTTVSVESGQGETQPVPDDVIEATPGLGETTPLPAATAEPLVVPVEQTFEYVVKPGDTLFSIALAFDTDVQTLRGLNNLPDDTIQVGQVLVVPGTGEGQAQPSGSTPEPVQTPEEVIYTVQTGDSLTGIAAEFGVEWQEIAAANGIEGPNYTIYRGQKLTIPGVSPTPVPTEELTVHVVQSGETLFSIAVQYGVTVQALLEANQLTNPDLINSGQELVIPQ